MHVTNINVYFAIAMQTKFRSMLHIAGQIMPAWCKTALLWLYNRPARISFRIYDAVSHGRIYCPDRLFLHWMYRRFTGRKLNLRHPVTFQDKLNWLKLYYRKPILTKLVDKYEVREWVAEKIGAEYLVPLYGVYHSFDEIDFDDLPEQFVLKCTHDSGSVILVKDKSKMDMKVVRTTLENALKRRMFYESREWPYKNVTPRIICEKYLIDNLQEDSPDYKFFCFSGEPKFIMVNTERHSATGLKTNLYDLNWNQLNVKDMDYPNNPKKDDIPEKFDKMLALSKTLSRGFPHVRVDFNYVNGQIYFGEMTFFHCGARKPFVPYEFNEQIGQWIALPPR